LRGGEKTGRGALIEDADAGETFQGGKHEGAVGLAVDRTVRSLQFVYGVVAVHADEEGVAKVAGGFKIGDMARVEQVEAAVGDDEFAVLVAQPRAPDGQGVPGDDFVAKIHDDRILVGLIRDWQRDSGDVVKRKYILAIVPENAPMIPWQISPSKYLWRIRS
jgi:hypothetical protein